MPEEAPTIHDITPIPLIAWEPGVREWLGLALLTLFLLGAVVVPAVVRARQRPRGVVARLLREVRRDTRSGTRRDAERASRAARRILEYLTTLPIAGLASAELQRHAEEVSSPEHRQALSTLADFEEHLYSPPTRDDVAMIHARAETLLAALEQLFLLWRKR
jgi:hypothetical protein